jgi:hypothetical protein
MTELAFRRVSNSQARSAGLKIQKSTRLNICRPLRMLPCAGGDQGRYSENLQP